MSYIVDIFPNLDAHTYAHCAIYKGRVRLPCTICKAVITLPVVHKAESTFACHIMGSSLFVTLHIV
jgi:hypothetical protein